MKIKNLLSTVVLITAELSAAEKPRLLVLTDIGGDPDDQQSMIRLMVYSNEFAIEGLVASASGIPGQLKTPVVRPDVIREIVSAYGVVRPNLARHAVGWPSAEELLRRIKSGNPNRGRAHVGPTHDTEGSRWLIDCIDAGAPNRPINISIWGGQTDLAQALWRVRHDRGVDGLRQFAQHFRVYDIGDQDGIADWMRGEFPGMFYILRACAKITPDVFADMRRASGGHFVRIAPAPHELFLHTPQVSLPVRPTLHVCEDGKESVPSWPRHSGRR